MSVKHLGAFSCMVAVLAAIMMSASNAQASALVLLPDSSKVDLSQKCPVCGMEIGKEGQAVTLTFKDGRVVGFHGVAAAVFKDGHVVGFEGARCLFIYNSIPEKYNANVQDIGRQYVTDFVSKKMIELPKAFLVLGSSVKGPMGYDLISFSSKEEAAKFASENDGKWIVQLHEIARTEEEAEKTRVVPQIGTSGVDERTGPILVPVPNPALLRKRSVEKTQRRAVPRYREEFDPYEPYADGFGHHGGGGGHHGH